MTRTETSVGSDATPQTPPTVQVVGVGKASAVPDVVRLSLSVRCDADDVGAALRAVGTRVEAIGRVAGAQGVAPADLRSSGAAVQPRYDRDGRDIIGYQASHSLAVVVRALDSVSALVDAVATEAGNALSVDSIQLDLSDTTPLEQAARDDAFAKAEAKAQQYAALSGARLGPVLAVVEGGSGSGSGPTPRMALMASASPSMPVQAGEQTVSATVTVTWSLVSPAARTAE